MLDAAALAATYPALASWTDIGDLGKDPLGGGAPGHDLFALKLTNNAWPGDKPALILISGTHSRDLAPVELNLRFAEYLLSGYGTDPNITWLLDLAEVHIILSANPDGRAVVEAQIASGEADEFGTTARKKNLNNATCPDPLNTGVDLDRNFPFQWQLGPTGCMSDYPGASAGSEPETTALTAYINTVLGIIALAVRTPVRPERARAGGIRKVTATKSSPYSTGPSPRLRTPRCTPWPTKSPMERRPHPANTQGPTRPSCPAACRILSTANWGYPP